MRVDITQGDITAQRVDAIVNAANSSLLGGGGVDGAIHHAAGEELLRECRELRRTRLPDGLPTGQAVATGAGDLQAHWVIHTVGPDAGSGQTDPALLTSAFASSLAEAARLGARSVAFPAISAGIYGWSASDVATCARRAIDQFAPHAGSVELVRFVLFSPDIRDVFAKTFADFGG